MQCPSCKRGSLRPGRLEHDLPGYSCSSCSGFLLSLSPYVDWAVKQKFQAQPQLAPFELVVRDNRAALRCPKCSRLMIKHRISAEATHGLDYCYGCDEAWLDGGEWAWLKSKGLQASITAISTDTWQHRVRQEYGEHLREERVKERVGEAWPEVQRVKQWLDAQPQRADILNYLNRE